MLRISTRCLLGVAFGLTLAALSTGFAAETVTAKRVVDHPVIGPELDASIGKNIQGPSVIRVPDWVKGKLGKYYLYFADHKGAYIRLAYADKIDGPWKIHVPGSMQLKDSFLLTEPPPVDEAKMARIRAIPNLPELSHPLLVEMTEPHIASPDVRVDETNRRIVMYYHGLNAFITQATRAATSIDGIHFDARPEIIGDASGLIGATYLKVFDYDGYVYGMVMGGVMYRSKDGLTQWEMGPRVFPMGGGPVSDMRHHALLVRGDTLYVFWTRAGAAPELIQVSTIDLGKDWQTWKASAPVEVLRPERPWEGADMPVRPSIRSTAYDKVNQLRDPAVYEEGGRTYLFYAVAGESGIGLAELFFSK